MKNVGNSSDGRSQGVPKISGHPCIGRMGALRGHLCDSTAFLFNITATEFNALAAFFWQTVNSTKTEIFCPSLQPLLDSFL